jgi:sec-independent protein translocase protein TatC
VFAVAAVLTPPDVISQIGLAIPILLLYELSIIAVRMVERRRAQAETAEEAADPAAAATKVDASG